jgi:hypothetical protein
VVAVLAAAASARADDTAQRDAQARFEEGLARVRADNLAGALVSFQQAYAVMHKPAVVWNLALTEEKTGRPVDALGHFREYLRVAPAVDPDRARAQKHIDGLLAATGHIDVAGPVGAAITVDGTQAVGATPLAEAIDVTPGHHEVEARLGTVVKTVGIDALAGQTMHADFRGMDTAAAPGAPGATAPQAEGATPPPGSEPPPPVPEQPSAYVAPTARLVTVIAVGGAAVLAGGAGLAFGLASTDKASAANSLRGQTGNCIGVTTGKCAQLASDTSTQQSDHVASTALWVVGGVLAAGAVGAFFVWPRAAAVSVAPAVGPASAGLTAVGTF